MEDPGWLAGRRDGGAGAGGPMRARLSASSGSLAHCVNQSACRAEHSTKDFGEETINKGGGRVKGIAGEVEKPRLAAPGSSDIPQPERPVLPAPGRAGPQEEWQKTATAPEVGQE